MRVGTQLAVGHQREGAAGARRRQEARARRNEQDRQEEEAAHFRAGARFLVLCHPAK